MANTYEKIAQAVVGSGGAANIEFIGIPGNFDDLHLKISARESGGNLVIQTFYLNNDTGNNYSYRRIQGAGSGTPNSASASSVSTLDMAVIPGSGDTASTFGSAEYYIANYTSSSAKSISSDSVTENNGTTAYQRLGAGLWTGTSAITSIKFAPAGTATFLEHSTATLYGIRKS